MYIRDRLRDETGFIIDDFNCGGGFGVRYTSADDPKEPALYIQHIAKVLKEICARHSYPVPHITVEPGRSIVGEAGYTLYTVAVSYTHLQGTAAFLCNDGHYPKLTACLKELSPLRFDGTPEDIERLKQGVMCVALFNEMFKAASEQYDHEHNAGIYESLVYRNQISFRCV